MDAAGLSIAIVGLIAEIAAAVERAQSAPKEIRGLYDRLKTLQGCLAQFETLLRSSDASSAIKAHLQRWDEVVKKLSTDANGLLGTIKELHEKLSGGSLKKLQVKMGFVIDRDKIRRLEGQLSTQIETLELLSGTLNVEQIAAVQRDLTSMNADLLGLGVRKSETSWKQGFSFSFHLVNVPIINEFIDRAEDMEALERVLLPRAPPYRRQVMILHGMGGIGKTQLAVEFARKHQKAFSSTFFIDADSKDSLLRGFLEIYRRIAMGGQSKEEDSSNSLTQLEDVAKKVLEWFDSEGNDSWLLIFDNADRAPDDTGGFDIQAYFPSRDVGSVLVTTRLATLPISGQRRNLSAMSLEQSSMLLRSYQLGTTSMDAEKNLLYSLAGLPLALSQAGRFISSLKIDLTEYLELYSSSKAEVITQLPISTHYEQIKGKGSVATTWMTSINLLKDRMSREDDCGKHHRAYHLLRLFAYFDPTNLDFDILRRGIIGNSVPRWFQVTFQSRIAFYSTVQVLLDLSLLDRTETSGSYAMHRVMYEWLVHFLVRETEADLLSLAVAAVGFSIPDVVTPDTPDEQAKLILHANAMLPRLVQKGYVLPHVDFQMLSSEDLSHASMLLDAEPQHLLMRRIEYPLRFPCNLFWMDGRKTVALNLLNKSIKHLQGKGGFEEDPVSLVLKYTTYSKIMISIPEETNNILCQLLEKFDLLNMPYWKIKTGNMLGLLMKQQERLNEAVNHWQTLLPECRNLYGSFHELTTMLFHNMMTCRVVMDVSKAKEHMETFREDAEAMALDNPKARDFLRQLGLLYIYSSDFKEADEVLRSVLTMETVLNGKDSIEVSQSYAGLAYLGMRYPQEDSIFHGQEWRRIQEHIYGSTPHRGTANSCVMLAELLCMTTGRQAEALACFSQGSEIYMQLKDFERVEKIEGRMEYIQQRGRIGYIKRRSRTRRFRSTKLG